jgi:hypothetical protein
MAKRENHSGNGTGNITDNVISIVYQFWVEINRKFLPDIVLHLLRDPRAGKIEIISHATICAPMVS